MFAFTIFACAAVAQLPQKPLLPASIRRFRIIYYAAALRRFDKNITCYPYSIRIIA